MSRRSRWSFLRNTRPKAVLVAEGDSWFSYPIETNILEELEKKYEVKETATTGDTLEEMAYSAQQINELIECLPPKDNPPKAILFSGGGNDFASALETILNYKGSDPSALNQAIFDEVIDVRLKNAYIKLINRVTCASKELYDNQKIPILIHGYDYPIPDGRGVEIAEFRFSGPWLKPAFKKKGYNNLEHNTKIMEEVIDRFNTMLKQLADKKFDHVKHVDLRNCLNRSLRGKAYRKHWDDELHPTSDGFEKIAKKFHAQIKQLPNPRVK